MTRAHVALLLAVYAPFAILGSCALWAFLHAVDLRSHRREAADAGGGGTAPSRGSTVKSTAPGNPFSPTAVGVRVPAADPDQPGSTREIRHA